MRLHANNLLATDWCSETTVCSIQFFKCQLQSRVPLTGGGSHCARSFRLSNIAGQEIGRPDCSSGATAFDSFATSPWHARLCATEWPGASNLPRAPHYLHHQRLASWFKTCVEGSRTEPIPSDRGAGGPHPHHREASVR